MKTVKERWRLRRRTVICALLYCAVVLTYLVLYGVGDSELHQTVAKDLMIIASTTVGAYVFGNVMDPGDDPNSDTLEDNELGTWNTRRKAIFSTLLFCAGMVSYFVIYGEDVPLSRTMADGFCLAAGSVIMTYVFGATWDDNKIKERLGS